MGPSTPRSAAGPHNIHHREVLAYSLPHKGYKERAVMTEKEIGCFSLGLHVSEPLIFTGWSLFWYSRSLKSPWPEEREKVHTSAGLWIPFVKVVVKNT